MYRCVHDKRELIRAQKRQPERARNGVLFMISHEKELSLGRAIESRSHRVDPAMPLRISQNIPGRFP
jgi:hypothetical protein